MAQYSKKTGSEQPLEYKGRKKMFGQKNMPKIFVLLTNPKMLVSFLSGILQVIMGMVIVSITILGLVRPLWLSAVLSLLGSIAAMLGGFLLYHTFAVDNSMESLINQAIKRVINSQN